MFTNWCRKYVGGIRLALTVFSLFLCSFVVVLDLISKEIELSGGGYTLLGGIILQVIASNWNEMKRPTQVEEPKCEQNA